MRKFKTGLPWRASYGYPQYTLNQCRILVPQLVTHNEIQEAVTDMGESALVIRYSFSCPPDISTNYPLRDELTFISWSCLCRSIG